MKNSVKDMEGKSELLSLKMRYSPYWASLVAQTVKRLPTTQETWVQSLGQEDPWRRKWQPTPVSCLKNPMDQRSLVGYSSWHCKSQTWLNDKHRDVVNFEIHVLNVCTVDHITFSCLLCNMHPFVFQCLCWLPLLLLLSRFSRVQLCATP